ncbi:MAG: prolipoprotein diacylglyceryl transferase [Candidatus Chromulinivorax sp.]
MSPILFHIHGSFAIHSFGVMLTIGVMTTLYLLHHDKQLGKYISDKEFTNLFQICFIAALIGGRTWCLITNPEIASTWIEVLNIWAGGLSILGALIGTCIAATSYLAYKKLSILHILDRLALYAPVAQSISRLGCFFAGCCYGQCTHVPWAVMYTDPDSLAPLHLYVHPTQIYSSLLLAIIFIVLYNFDHSSYKKIPGQLTALYIMLMSFERFVVDFFRADQEFFTNSFLSVQQLLALILFLTASIFMIIISFDTKNNQ